VNWALLIPIIANYGLPLAEKLWQKWSSKSEPTQADWDELKALGAQTMESQLLAALGRNGISASDPRAVELLKLVQGQK
jgi:hypothetical protein